jgi:5,10-methylene-tetrahydrofolate dehydrogenase/methenyl tetrahydrofolate cyclohydrolase
MRSLLHCHRHVTLEDQKRLIREADILVTAVGAAEYRVTADMVKPGVATRRGSPRR